MEKTELQPEEFTLLLRKFNKIVADMPHVGCVEEALTEMRIAANDNPLLNHRQKDGIMSRCENYLKRDYGGSTRQHFVGGKPKPTNGKEKE